MAYHSRAYYGLQGAGVCCDGAPPKTLSHIYKAAIQTILTYGCPAINITDRSVKSLEKTHWRIEGGGQGGLAPPPLKLVKV